MSKYTPWFVAGQQNPVRVGVYQISVNDCQRISYKHWDGRYWGWFTSSPKRAEKNQPHSNEPSQKNFEWRGLTKPTGAKK